MNIHTFDNGVRVYEHHLLAAQKKRYLENNLHEPEEESVFIETIDRLEEGASFVNIGAAIGYYCILAKRRRPDLAVHAYEPLTMHRQRMRQNVKLNGLRRNDITIHDEGIDRTDGVASFRSQDFSSAIERNVANLHPLMKFFHRFRKDLIKTISLESAIERCSSKVGLVSMDIQGAEISVVNASMDVIAAKQVDSFLIGTHGPRIHEDVVDALKRCDYKILVSEFETKLQPDGIVLAQKNAEPALA